MKFKIDENLPIELATVLRERGYDADTVRDEDLSGTVDQNLYTITRRERRILVTLDLGFADIRSYPPSESVGIIVLRLPSQDKVTVIDAFRTITGLLTREPLEGRLWIVEADRIRIRE